MRVSDNLGKVARWVALGLLLGGLLTTCAQGALASAPASTDTEWVIAGIETVFSTQGVTRVEAAEAELALALGAKAESIELCFKSNELTAALAQLWVLLQAEDWKERRFCWLSFSTEAGVFKVTLLVISIGQQV